MRYREGIKSNVQVLNQNPQTNKIPYCDHRHTSSTANHCVIANLHSQSSKNSSKIALNVSHFSLTM